MTVEAALVLPLALFFFLALLKPVTWLDRQRKVQTAMERIGEEISQYGILEKSVETGDSELPAFCTALRQLFGSGEKPGSTRIM